MRPVLAAAAPGATEVSLLVATDRKAAEDDSLLFTGERGERTSFTEIGVSIPPAHKPGEIEWPDRTPGNPSRDFVTTRVASLDQKALLARVRQAAPRQGGRVLVFVHGYNNLFEDAVYRFAQIAHDSKAPAVPVLFTWPSRGKLLAYPYDRESANYSRDALERLLQDLAAEPSVREVAVLAHSMGNWVTLEALRQQAIRKGAVPKKITNVMLAAPDVDVDVARTQIDGMGPARPRFTLFVSQDDRALGLSGVVWGGTARLGAIDPTKEPYRSELEKYRIGVIDLTAMNAGDRLNHGKFAEAPEVVQFIGAQLASGQELDTRKAGLGDHIGMVVTGTANTVGTAASAVIAAPIAVIDPATRRNLGDRIGAVVPRLGNTPDPANADKAAAAAAAQAAPVAPIESSN